MSHSGKSHEVDAVRHYKAGKFQSVTFIAMALILTGTTALAAKYEKKGSFAETLAACRVAKMAPMDVKKRLKADFPLEYDWFSQDYIRPDLEAIKDPAKRQEARLEIMFVDKRTHKLASKNIVNYLVTDRDSSLELQVVQKAVTDLGKAGEPFKKLLAKLRGKTAAGDPAWLQLYVDACKIRRTQRLKTVATKASKILFVKRHAITPSFYAYTEGQSDAQAEVHYMPGGSLCLWEIKDGKETVTTLLEAKGVIRDLDVSWDGKKILFAWKKGHNIKEDDYHLYEMDVATREVRQLTKGIGVADYECKYLPNGDIIFNSSRCVQTVDCWTVEVSNLYTCDKDGKYLRRLTFDQVHTTHPALMDNGTVIYTRWDYNDRSQTPPQPLFMMNPDGTGQTEFYGNNSYFPTSILHARGIPGSDKVLAIVSGHHTWQVGKLAIIDRSKGTQDGVGIDFVAPYRDLPKVYIDRYGQDEEQFRHPWPLNKSECLVSMTPRGGNGDRHGRFGLYYMNLDGRRELLHFDPAFSCDHPTVLGPRKRPHVRASSVDYTKTEGTYFMQDVYVGPGLKGIPRGTIKKLRVVALEFRAAWVQGNRNSGPEGRAYVSTPISRSNGSWDVKKILGEAKVYEDGSAMFKVPARTPVYFQCIDEKGQVVQTMRSWSTLMPGETFGCVGCHEDKNTAPLTQKSTIAMKKGAQKLDEFYGPARGFSYMKEIQPIMDKHCIKCHDGVKTKIDKRTGKKGMTLIDLTSKTDEPKPEHAAQYKEGGRAWARSYLSLTQNAPRSRMGSPTKWLSPQSGVKMLPPYYTGAVKSPLLKMLREGHGKTKLNREELDKICAWIDLVIPYCGDYVEANVWSKTEVAKYLHFQRKRERYATIGRRNIEALLKDRHGKTHKIADPAPRYSEWEGKAGTWPEKK